MSDLSEALALLSALRQTRVEIRAANGRLQVRGRLPADLAARLRRHRRQVLAVLAMRPVERATGMAKADPRRASTSVVVWADPVHRHVVEAMAERDANRLSAQVGTTCTSTHVLRASQEGGNGADGPKPTMGKPVQQQR